MKKYLIQLVFVILAITGYSTDRTLPTRGSMTLAADPTQNKSITWSYTGVAADSLTGNQDSIVYNIVLNKSWPANYYIKLGFDTLAGADTTLKININGRMFDDQSWTLIETTTSSAISAATDVVIESMTDADYTYGTTQASSSIASYNSTIAAHVITSDTATFKNYTADTLRVAAQTMTNAAQTITNGAQTMTPVPSIKPCYRQIQVEIVYNGPDYTGGGISLEDIEWYFQEAK